MEWEIGTINQMGKLRNASPNLGGVAYAKRPARNRRLLGETDRVGAEPERDADCGVLQAHLDGGATNTDNCSRGPFAAPIGHDWVARLKTAAAASTGCRGGTSLGRPVGGDTDLFKEFGGQDFQKDAAAPAIAQIIKTAPVGVEELNIGVNTTFHVREGDKFVAKFYAINRT